MIFATWLLLLGKIQYLLVQILNPPVTLFLFISSFLSFLFRFLILLLLDFSSFLHFSSFSHLYLLLGIYMSTALNLSCPVQLSQKLCLLFSFFSSYFLDLIFFFFSFFFISLSHLLYLSFALFLSPSIS